MDRYFRLYLTGVLICFTLIFSIAIGLFDYNKGQKQMCLNHEKEIDMIGNAVVRSLHTIEKVYNLTDEAIGREMEENAETLVQKYIENPIFEEWDFEALKNEFGMDVYVIDDTSTVIHSSFEKDVGMNFKECCKSFGEALDRRRLEGEFKHDNLDIQQASGEIKKFGYIPTPDRKYLLELSMALENDIVFEHFNFLREIEQLEKAYEPVQSIRVYNPTGIRLGYTDDEGQSQMISEERRTIFEEVKSKNKQNEMVQIENGTNITYRYIPYVADEQRDFSMKRIVEIVYTEAELDSLLKFYRGGFFYQQLIIVFAVILLATIIGKIIAKPVHYAFHDSLTGLKNRAAFEMEGNRRLQKKRREPVTLIMIDVDNFKNVNDKLGHMKGDRLLIDIAQNMERMVRKEGVIARIGGDEFVILCSNQKKETLEQLVHTLILSLNEIYRELNEEHHLNVSISIGIAEALENEDLKSLYDRADKALYMAKENGKNQYKIWTNEGVQQV